MVVRVALYFVVLLLATTDGLARVAVRAEPVLDAPGLRAVKFTWFDERNAAQTECAATADGRYAVLYSRRTVRGSDSMQPSSGTWWSPEETLSTLPGTYSLYTPTDPGQSRDNWAARCSECPWPHLPTWIAMLRSQPDFRSGIDPASGFLTYSSDALGRALAWDAAGNLRSLRLVTKTSADAGSYVESVFLFAEYAERDGVQVPTKRKNRVSFYEGGTQVRRSEQEFTLATFSKSPQLVEDALSTRQIKATMNRREPNGDIFSPSGQKIYNEHELSARIAGDLTGNTTRARWSYWIVGGLTAFTLLLVGFKYWRRV